MPQLSSSEIKNRIQHIKSLPTLPGVVKKLCSVVENDESSVAKIADIISTDQVISAKVLKIVNSPFYGFPGRISTVNHAIVLLGFNVIKGIVITAAVIDHMTSSMVGLWEHSLGVAATSGIIARRLQIPEPEEVSTAGLLHDLGKVILCTELRTEADEVMANVSICGKSFLESERKILDGICHCEIVGWLAEDWNLPPRLREPMVMHHWPEVAEFAQVPTAIVHLADIITRSLQFGSGGDPFVPPISPAAMSILNLKLADLASLLEEIDDELDGIDTSDFS